MSNHNFTNVIFSSNNKRRISTLASNQPLTTLKNLELLGLIAHSDAFHKLVSDGTAKISALAEKRKFFEYEVDEAFKEFDAPLVDRLSFKINLERAGLMKPNAV
jgi:hypothetical protein